MLGTIATSMIGVTGTVFSITMVILQLATSQFSQRVLGSFLDSRVTQATLGIFTATFLYALTMLRSVRGDEANGEPFVPQIAVSAAYPLVLASIACLLAFIHYITTSIQLARVVRRVARDGESVVERTFPEVDESYTPEPFSPNDAAVRQQVLAGKSGRLVHIDSAGLYRIAVDSGVVIECLRQVGRFCAEGQPLAIVHGLAEDLDANSVAQQFRLEPNRTTRQDTAFVVRQLVDIGASALSPGVNDPTTAVQAVDSIHHVLRRLVQRQNPSSYVVTETGEIAVILKPQRVAELLLLGIVEIATYGKDSPHIPVRLRDMIDDLISVARPEYGALLHRLRDQAGTAPHPIPT